MEDFSASNIKAVNIVFTPGTDFENLPNRAQFNPVTSRTAQAATLKAEKMGATTVDLNAAKTVTKTITPSDSGSGSGSQTDDTTHP